MSPLIRGAVGHNPMAEIPKKNVVRLKKLKKTKYVYTNETRTVVTACTFKNYGA